MTKTSYYKGTKKLPIRLLKPGDMYVDWEGCIHLIVYVSKVLHDDYTLSYAKLDWVRWLSMSQEGLKEHRNTTRVNIQVVDRET